jgi:hypothetical protein
LARAGPLALRHEEPGQRIRAESQIALMAR